MSEPSDSSRARDNFRRWRAPLAAALSRHLQDLTTPSVELVVDRKTHLIAILVRIVDAQRVALRERPTSTARSGSAVL